MITQYRYKGKFISAANAARLGNFKNTRSHVSTSVKEKAGGKSLLESPRYYKKDSIELKTAVAIASDRKRHEAERQERIRREKARTAEFERAKLAPPRRPVEYPSYPEYEGGGGGAGGAYFPSDEEDEESLEDFTDLEPIPGEDYFIDDYAGDAIEVADIDSDHYQADQ